MGVVFGSLPRFGYDGNLRLQEAAMESFFYLLLLFFSFFCASSLASENSGVPHQILHLA